MHVCGVALVVIFSSSAEHARWIAFSPNHLLCVCHTQSCCHTYKPESSTFAFVKIWLYVNIRRIQYCSLIQNRKWLLLNASSNKLYPPALMASVGFVSEASFFLTLFTTWLIGVLFIHLAVVIALQVLIVKSLFGTEVAIDSESHSHPPTSSDASIALFHPATTISFCSTKKRSKHLLHFHFSH